MAITKNLKDLGALLSGSVTDVKPTEGWNWIQKSADVVHTEISQEFQDTISEKDLYVALPPTERKLSNFFTYIVPIPSAPLEKVIPVRNQISLPEGEFLRKKEFHITALGFWTSELLERAIEFSNDDEQEKVKLSEKINTLLSQADFSFTIDPNSIKLVHNKEYDSEAVLNKKGKKQYESEYTIIVDVKMPGMDELYGKLNELNLDLDLWKPATHITLYIKQNDEATGYGIGITDFAWQVEGKAFPAIEYKPLSLSKYKKLQAQVPSPKKNIELTPELKQKVFNKALELSENARPNRDAPHLLAVNFYMEKLIEKEGGNPRILFPSADFHDIGWVGLLSKGYSHGQVMSMQKEHMQAGAEMTRDILKETNAFSDDEIDKICSLILLHDELDRISWHNAQLLFEADSLAQIDTNMAKPTFDKTSYWYFLRRFEEKRAPLFKTATGKKLLAKLLPEAQQYLRTKM